MKAPQWVRLLAFAFMSVVGVMAVMACAPASQSQSSSEDVEVLITTTTPYAVVEVVLLLEENGAVVSGYSNNSSVHSPGRVIAYVNIELLPAIIAIEGVGSVEVLPDPPLDPNLRLGLSTMTAADRAFVFGGEFGGEVGRIGQALDCDNLLQQQMLSSPLATANEANANTVIASIQNQRPADCSPDTWNPWVVGSTGTAPFDVDVPPTLAEGGAAAVGVAFANTPWRDNLGNIGIDFVDDGTERGSPVTLPLDRGTRWMYLSNQGRWYAAN